MTPEYKTVEEATAAYLRLLVIPPLTFDGVEFVGYKVGRAIKLISR